MSSTTVPSGVKKPVAVSWNINAEAVKKYLERKSAVDSGFPLLQLPAEIRLQILKETLATDVPLRLLWNRPDEQSDNARHSVSYGLMCANKQLHAECQEILFKEKPFILHVNHVMLPEAADNANKQVRITPMTPEEVVTLWKSLHSFRTIILSIDSLHPCYSTPKNLRVILGSFFGSNAKDLSKKVIIRIDLDPHDFRFWLSKRFLSALQSWLSKSNSIRLECDRVMLNGMLRRYGDMINTDKNWYDFFRRFRNRLDVDGRESLEEDWVSRLLMV